MLTIRILLVLPFWLHMLFGTKFLPKDHAWSKQYLPLLALANGRLGPVEYYGLAYWCLIAFWFFVFSF